MPRIWSTGNGNVLGMFIHVLLSLLLSTASFCVALLCVTSGEAAPQKWLHRASDPFLHRAGAHLGVLFCKNDLITEKIPRETSEVCVLAQF